QSGKILEISLSSERPAKDLLEMGKTLAEKKEAEGLHDIDAALTGLMVDYIRKGTRDQIEVFTDDITAFLDSKNGDRLKSFSEGERYFYRWEHLVDFSRLALENYDPDMTSRFIASRKHGGRLLEIVYKTTGGIQPKDLAKKLDISEQNLSKHLRVFESQDLVIRQKGKKATLVHLGFMGRVYMSEIMEAQGSERIEPAKLPQPYDSPWFNNRFPDLYDNLGAIRIH
ncbi:MAG: hypothetical protein C0407_04585, partial [Desulfobacca sp.]|nr:hypothetical protein [Desulfobacca sp.]